MSKFDTLRNMKSEFAVLNNELDALLEKPNNEKNAKRVAEIEVRIPQLKSYIRNFARQYGMHV